MTGARISGAQAWLVDLPVEQVRTDAIQSFVKQETILVHLECEDGHTGTGYAYTIGHGGRAVLELLRGDLLERVEGQDATRVEALWQDLFWARHALTVGPVSSLALAAIDTAVWDLAGQRTGLSLWRMAGGAQERVAVYDTEGGWLHLDVDDLVAGAEQSRDAGWRGVKLKVGRPSPAEDQQRVAAVREAVGPAFEIMVDANQSQSAGSAARLARLLEPVDVAWLEEPLPADDVAGHRRLAAETSVPVAVGESLYSPGQFAQYLEAGAADVVQVDAARVGGITPWLKVAHLAEALGRPVAPHFLMELHVSLAAAVPNGTLVEHIPQLRAVTRSEVDLRDGHAHPPDRPGLGIDWDWDRLDELRVA